MLSLATCSGLLLLKWQCCTLHGCWRARPTLQREFLGIVDALALSRVGFHGRSSGTATYSTLRLLSHLSGSGLLELRLQSASLTSRRRYFSCSCGLLRLPHGCSL